MKKNFSSLRGAVNLKFYLKPHFVIGAGISHRRGCHDARVTYEGDNNVLLQQTSNWLLRQLHNPENASEEFPLSSILFLQDFSTKLKTTWSGTSIQDVCTNECRLINYRIPSVLHILTCFC